MGVNRASIAGTAITEHSLWALSEFQPSTAAPIVRPQGQAEGSNAARAQAHVFAPGEYVSIRDRDSDEIRTFRVGRDGGLIRRAAIRLS